MCIYKYYFLFILLLYKKYISEVEVSIIEAQLKICFFFNFGKGWRKYAKSFLRD